MEKKLGCLAIFVCLLFFLGCDDYQHAPYGTYPDGGGSIDPGNGDNPADTDTDEDPDTDTDTDSDTDWITECEMNGGYCAEICGYGYYMSEAYVGCVDLEVCCLPYMDDDSCIYLPTECADIGVDEDTQYYGCCWSNSVYWCDQADGDFVQSEACSDSELCSYSYEYESLWCI